MGNIYGVIIYYSIPVGIGFPTNHFKHFPDIKVELQAQLKKMEAAMAAGQQDEIINFYTNDCRLLPPGAPIVVGDDDILCIRFVGNSCLRPYFTSHLQLKQD